QPRLPTVCRTGQANLTVRKVYDRDRLRLLRCRTCGEEFSERRGIALFNTKIAEEQAASVINHLGEGYGVRATTRLVHLATDTVARLLRMAGRHAERFHKKSRSVARWRSAPRRGTCGIIPRWLPTAN